MDPPFPDDEAFWTEWFGEGNNDPDTPDDDDEIGGAWDLTWSWDLDDVSDPIVSFEGPEDDEDEEELDDEEFDEDDEDEEC
jgi:hypothetical protein